MRAITHANSAGKVDPPLCERIVLLEELDHIKHHPIPEQAPLARVEDPRGNLVEDELLLTHVDGVTGVRPALIASDEVDVLRKDIDDLSLTLVAPLAADDDSTATFACFGHLVGDPIWGVSRDPVDMKKALPRRGLGLLLHPLKEARRHE